MSTPLISVEALGKKYRIRHQQAERYVALRDVIMERAGAPWRWLTGRARPADRSTEDFWAVKDVSFNVGEGEVLGIIGRNGAGKSTLLKILSRITEPTEGRVVLRGRAASLLEVGTGFHPELTGRENIYLNGSILGMSRAEIARKFDEIVAFAGTERFLDTPVKRYSSGMYVRLAFAVAAHLEPEILIVDEVLAVGDTEFQQKCLGKMGEVARSGRTVLFVSHYLATIENLCRTGLLLERGRVAATGPMREVIAAYSATSHEMGSEGLLERKDRQGNGEVRFAGVTLRSADGAPLRSLTVGSTSKVELRMQNAAHRVLRGLHVAVGINNSVGHRITTWSTIYAGGDLARTPAGDFTLVITLPRLALLPGRYSYNLFATVNGDVADWLRPGGSFDVDAGDYYGTGQLPETRDAAFVADHSFEIA